MGVIVRCFFPSIGEIFAFVTDIRKRYANTGAAS
jgi:hypothetical protein